MRTFSPLIILLVFLLSCEEERVPLLESMMKERGGVVSEVYQDAEKFRLQIQYTQINRDAENQPSFHSHSFRLNKDEYFYPASTVKFPAAVLALEKLKQLNIDGLDRETSLRIDSVYSGQSQVVADSSAQNYLPSIGNYIKKVMVVSDNDAFNRLYEFLGQEALNQALWDKGLLDTKISHRLSIALSEAENQHTNPFTFYEEEKEIYREEGKISQLSFLDGESLLLGKGEMRGGERINQAKDFASKNRFPIEDQQRLLKSVFFPNSVMGSLGFDLSEEDRQFLWKYMSILPRESRYPSYPDSSYYYDSYVKFFMFGDNQEKIPDHIRVFNKVGVAYGFLTDNAYIIDLEKGIEFMLTATIFVNENQIFNDDTYEYEEIGFPFLAELGRMIYEFEEKRQKKHRADLKNFRMIYN
ncbi:MAG: serine hydrolase [Bacteroidia bacterium]|nr:serine hydrolase [Bacteroidia bacterium]